MKRSDFLKKIGIGIGVAIVAPTVLAETLPKEEKSFPDITGNNGELVEVALFNHMGELSHKQYSRQIIPFKIKFENSSVRFDMPDTVFPIKGKVAINEVRIFHKRTGQDWGRIIYGDYTVWDGTFTICWNG